MRNDISPGLLESLMNGVVPDSVARYSVVVGGVRYPVKQVYAAATGRPRTSFNSITARNALERAGVVVDGAARPREPEPEIDQSEATVQATLVQWLTGHGWTVLSTADTATRERGIDVVAERSGERVGIEVKGWPSRRYTDPRRAHEVKPTRPSVQAKHWYAEAVLAALRLRTKQPNVTSVIALPDMPRYRNLHSETRLSLDAVGVQVWWVQRDGAVLSPG